MYPSPMRDETTPSVTSKYAPASEPASLDLSIFMSACRSDTRSSPPAGQGSRDTGAATSGDHSPPIAERLGRVESYGCAWNVPPTRSLAKESRGCHESYEYRADNANTVYH